MKLELTEEAENKELFFKNLKLGGGRGQQAPNVIFRFEEFKKVEGFKQKCLQLLVRFI